MQLESYVFNLQIVLRDYHFQDTVLPRIIAEDSREGDPVKCCLLKVVP